jgi:hypothetical protein
MDGYLSLSKEQTQKTFPVKYCGQVGPDLKIKSLSAGPSGIWVTTNKQHDIVLVGKDKLQKEWTATVDGEMSMGIPFDAYAADLDHDGTQDIILVSGTGGNGLAPSSHLLCFLFDNQGRPVPFTADGYFDYSETGIRDILDINGDGKATLVYMNYDDGYWITSLYHAERGHWQCLQRTTSGQKFPIFTRFTNRDNHVPVTPKTGRHPFAPDLANLTPNTRGVLTGYRWANVGESQDIQLEILTSNGQRVTCQPASWYSTFSVVLDEPSGRQIVSLSANEKSVRLLLDKIVTSRFPVTVSGQRNRKTLSPELLWAGAHSGLGESITISDTKQTAAQNGDGSPK